MYPAHYNVPDGLNIRCIGYVRWAETEHGYHLTTLWRDTEGNDYFCEDVWTPFSTPFWLGTRMSDLVPCTSVEFAEHAQNICLSIEDEEERLSAYYRYHELMLVWGYAKGTELGFDHVRHTARNE